jgi:hypothetical protein
VGSSGLITSFLTATYMFRLVFLTFHGERVTMRLPRPHIRKRKNLRPRRRMRAHGGRTSPLRPRTSDTPAGHGGHGHAASLHDAPAPMALALIRPRGRVRIPPASSAFRMRSGGSNRIEAFLDPAFEAHDVAPANPEFQVVPGRLREDAGVRPGSGHGSDRGRSCV